MTDQQKMKTIEVSVRRPFAAVAVHSSHAAGKSVAGILEEALPDPWLRHHAHVFIGGHHVPRESWNRITPKAGACLDVRCVPTGGGGGKNPLRTILSLAIMAASPALTGALTGFLGAASARFVTAGVGMLGKLALNAIAPPPKPRFSAQKKESPTLFIQGARNQASPFARVPKVLGRHRFVPPLGALPYTETAGNDQYLRMLFVWGYGPLHISDLKIGETPLAEFDGVEVETRGGYDTDEPLTLYTNAVLQNDLQVTLRQSDGYVTRTTEEDADEISVDLTLPRGLFRFNGGSQKASSSVAVEVQYSPAGMDDWSAGAGGFKAVGSRTSGGYPRPDYYEFRNNQYDTVRIDRLVMDAASGALRIIRGTVRRIGLGDPQADAPAVPQDCLLLAKIERRASDPDIIPSGRLTDERSAAVIAAAFENGGDFLCAPAGAADTLSVAAGGIKFPGFSLTAKQATAIRKSISFKVPRGQYDVRLRRLTADATVDDIFDETVWTALRTVRHTQPIRMEGLALTALRIKATDQLQGVLERFNGVVHSVIPDWNGTAWVPQVTSNPASVFRHVLQGAGNARPLADTRLDLARLQEWHEACADAGREFNAVIDYDISVREVLEDVAATGRASPALIDGKWSVITDAPQQVPVQHFSPRNTWGFQGQKAFDELPQALRVRFVNKDKGWMQDERLVFDDGITAETATRYETLELNGVTDKDQAWSDGRYHIATARLRPETYVFHADIEHIVCTRGDLVRFSHDVPMFGIMSARVKLVDALGVVLDAAVTMEEGRHYAVRFRTAAGATLLKNVATVAGTTQELAFEIPEAEGLAAGDLALFGERGSESVELLVKSIEPGPDLSAKLTCVDAAPAIHDADTGEIPDFVSHVTLPPELRRPPTPLLAEIQSGEEALVRHTDGSFTTRILILLQPPHFDGALTLQAALRAADETQFRGATVLAASRDSLSLTDVAEGEIYDIQLRYVTATGVMSPPLLISGHRVTGTTALPSDVTGLSANVLGDTAHLSWEGVTDIDLSHYVLRYAPAMSGVLWSNAVDIVGRIPKGATSVSLPAASGTYLLKAVDLGGRYSENAAALSASVGNLAGYNAVVTVTETPEFPGGKTGVGVSDGALQLEGADSLDDWEDIDGVGDADIGDSGLCGEGVYAFSGIVDLGCVCTSRLTAAMEVSGLDLNATVDTWDAVDSVESFDQDVDPSLWTVALQVSATEDDPEDDPAWSDYAPFIIGDYRARAFRFRLVLSSRAALVTPSVSGLTVTVDMQERTASSRGLVSDAAGSVLSFATPFRETPVIAVMAQDMATGDYFTVYGQTASGFTVRFFNAAGTGIVRNFDYLAVGYGESAS